jgi:hypothetical protein
MECSDQVYNFDMFRPSRQATKVFYASDNVPSNKRRTQHSSAWEARRDDLTFYGEMKRVMIILRILGVLPYSKTSAGKSNFKQRDLQNWFNILKCIAWNFYTQITGNLFSISLNFTKEHYYEEVYLVFSRIPFMYKKHRISNYTQISSLKINYLLIREWSERKNHKYTKY